MSFYGNFKWSARHQNELSCGHSRLQISLHGFTMFSTDIDSPPRLQNELPCGHPGSKWAFLASLWTSTAICRMNIQVQNELPLGHPDSKWAFMASLKRQRPQNGHPGSKWASMWSSRLQMSLHGFPMKAQRPQNGHPWSFHVVIQAPNEPLWLHWNLSGHRMVI